MGLLSRAANAAPALDELGEALKDRILRIPSGSGSVDTALSLLKAYGAFQTGYCFSLSGDVYTCYASTGTIREKISIDRRRIPQGRNGDYFRSPDLVPQGDESWIFPLDDKKTHLNFILLTTKKGTLFYPEEMALIIRNVRSVLLPRGEKGPPEDGKNTESSSSGLLQEGQKKRRLMEVSPAGIEEAIGSYYKNHSEVYGFVLEMGESGGWDDSSQFAGEIRRVISSLGEVFPLPSLYCLVLVPVFVDWELLARHLSKSLKIKTPFHFKANSTNNALKLLHSYL
jgi:hypothetical protein